MHSQLCLLKFNRVLGKRTRPNMDLRGCFVRSLLVLIRCQGALLRGSSATLASKLPKSGSRWLAYARVAFGTIKTRSSACPVEHMLLEGIGSFVPMARFDKGQHGSVGVVKRCPAGADAS